MNRNRLAHVFELLKKEDVEQFHQRISGLNNKIWNEQRNKIGESRSFDDFYKHFAFVDIELSY